MTIDPGLVMLYEQLKATRDILSTSGDSVASMYAKMMCAQRNITGMITAVEELSKQNEIHRR
jgi:hypothetical protein